MAQCPNCGGFKVGYQHPGGGCWPWIGILLGISTVFGIIMSIESGKPPLDSRWGYIADWVASIACLGGLGVLFLVGGILGLSPTAPHLLECYLCGYKWDSRTNPQVTVRPDLIIKGEERLRAEAEEERKRQEAAWWSWWSQQQRKK